MLTKIRKEDMREELQIGSTPLYQKLGRVFRLAIRVLYIELQELVL